MTYLLDANIFIQAKNLHYSFDFCPAFWEWVEQANSRGKLFSISQVRTELIAGDDSLADWARQRNDGFFLSLSSDIVPSLATVSRWASSARYETAAVSTFLQQADYYLVAHALAGKYTVVTHEIPSSSTKRIKIPDACVAFNVQVMSPYEMLRLERARFVLGSR